MYRHCCFSYNNRRTTTMMTINCDEQRKSPCQNKNDTNKIHESPRLLITMRSTTNQLEFNQNNSRRVAL
jgi:hypothetical protein